MTARPAAPAGRTRARLLAVLTVILALAALKLSRPVTMPLVTGLMIAALVWPVQHRLQRSIPRPLALLAAVLVAVVTLFAVLGALWWSADAILAEMRRKQDRLAAVHQQLSGMAARVGVTLPDVKRGAAGPRAAPEPTTSSPGAPGGATRPSDQSANAPGGQSSAGQSSGGQDNGIAKRAGRSLYHGIAFLALAIGFAALVLAELRDLRERIRRRFPPERAERLLAAAAELAEDTRRYFMVKSLTCAITGVASLLLALAVGLDFAFVWGFLAFLFEYVPTVGSVLAVVPPALYATLQFGVAKALAITAGFTVMQLALGNYIDPRIEGKLLALSPLVVLLSIVFWAWMWGAPGALLGVPLTLATLGIARRFPETHWLWALLTESRHDDEANGKTTGADRDVRAS